jgi:hypothetical protein
MIMKRLLLSLLVILTAATVMFAQKAPDSKQDKELTCEEAAIRIQEWDATVKSLQSQLAGYVGDVDKLTKDIEIAKANLKNCRDEIRKLVGATDQDIEAFRQKLGVIEGKIRNMRNLSDDELADRRAEVEALEAELNELRKSKIAILPEFYNRIIQDAKDIRALYREKKIKTYTVGTWAEDKDCLWNIAGKIEIFGDPFLWPKIWQANKDGIRNPDIIYPGQVLTLPQKGPKDADEMKAERKYWRKKREAAESSATQEPAPAQKGQ